MKIKKEFIGLILRDTLMMIGIQVVVNLLFKELGFYDDYHKIDWFTVITGFLYALGFRFLDWKEAREKKRTQAVVDEVHP